MTAKIHVLFLITSTNVGGTERALSELVRGLSRETYTISVCSIKKPGLFAEKIAAGCEGFYTLGLPESGGWRAVLNAPLALLRLLRLLRACRPRILHSFLFRANLLGRLAGRAAGVPHVICSVRVIEEGKLYKHLLDRLTSGLVDRYTAVSEAARRFTLQQVNLPNDKIVTIHNGIDCARFTRNVDTMRPVTEKNSIALVGRFDKQKGHAMLLHAAQLMLRQGTAAQVYFFGEGPEERSIRTLAHRLGLAAQVHCMGAVADIAEWIARMEIIALPSLWEGLPNVLLEAMALSKPIVASRVPGIDEVVVDGETGLLCPPGDAPALAEALTRCLSDRDLAGALGRAGHKRVQQLFSLHATIDRTTSLYTSLLAPPEHTP